MSTCVILRNVANKNLHFLAREAEFLAHHPIRVYGGEEVEGLEEL